MATAADAFTAIKTRAADQITTLPVYWQHEENILPDTPTPFVFFVWDIDRAYMAAGGGGRGNNLYRSAGELVGYVLYPRGQGMEAGFGYAETVAAAFRSYRDTTISCFGASLIPSGEGSDLNLPGMTGGVAGNYACIAVAIDIQFDQIS